MMKMMADAEAAFEDTSEEQKKRDSKRGYPRAPAHDDKVLEGPIGRRAQSNRICQLDQVRV